MGLNVTTYIRVWDGGLAKISRKFNVSLVIWAPYSMVYHFRKHLINLHVQASGFAANGGVQTFDHDTSSSTYRSQNTREHLPVTETVNSTAKVDAQTQTTCDTASILLLPLGYIIINYLAHRSAQDGVEFLCIKLQWHSQAELGRFAPDMLNEYIHKQGL
ncbi:uncharacterized protein ATNIH1004_011782 [Aspergillus tanneri]|uniref:Uncharacterized protein n=1 Tax=Aspergillus tanneri TaxID=1220188 RepID=A0A5M9M7T4_9EURO|nr:uncharacterized protein ATNIH1004_011782 [Aspergillus tanneri]KAA8641646.1 hypothetical protein ATNIH1004_011782 [Aspergillus tanneri]